MPSLPIDLQKNDMIAEIKAGVSHNILHSVFNQGKEQLCKSVKMAEGGNGQRTIREVQQTFGHSLGYANEIIWDLLSVDQAHILKVKIQNLIQDPEVPAGLDENERVKAQAKVDKQKAANNNIRENFFNAIWTQRKYSNLQSLTSIFYVMVATDETDHMAALNATKWSCHPVVRVRRCISICEDSANSSDCCMVFVDDQGRVYQNWSSYVENNELPKGIMVAPRRGVYNLINNVVQLETWVTPVATTKRQVLNAMDTTTAVTGLAAASVPLLGLLAVPVAGPVMAAAGFAALVCGGYGLGRSASQLADRSIHEQSISITDRTARNHWLGVGGGTVALGAAGATTLLTAATNAGREVGAITQLTVNGMNISSIMISGTGLANGIVDLVLKYMDGDDISAMDALQLSASLVLFTHSVYNFKLASTIINETTNNRIGAYRETLSNRQRRMFDKLSKETIRTRGASQGKLDIIRNVNEMPSRKEFNDLYKINKKLNQNGIRPSFDADGKGLLLNNEVKTTGAELRANLQHNKGPDVLGKVTQPIPESHKVNGVVSTPAATLRSAWLSAPSPTLTNQMDQSNSNYGEGVDILRLSSLVCNGVMIALSRYGSEIYEHIVNAESFETALLSLADVLPGETMTFILNMTKIFMENMWQDLYNVLHFYLSSEMVLYRIGIHILDNCREYSIKQLNDNFSDILAAVRSYFLSLNPNGNGQERMKCKFCPGYYTTCDL